MPTSRLSRGWCNLALHKPGEMKLHRKIAMIQFGSQPGVSLAELDEQRVKSGFGLLDHVEHRSDRILRGQELRRDGNRFIQMHGRNQLITGG